MCQIITQAGVQINFESDACERFLVVYLNVIQRCPTWNPLKDIHYFTLDYINNLKICNCPTWMPRNPHLNVWKDTATACPKFQPFGVYEIAISSQTTKSNTLPPDQGSRFTSQSRCPPFKTCLSGSFPRFSSSSRRSGRYFLPPPLDPPCLSSGRKVLL